MTTTLSPRLIGVSEGEVVAAHQVDARQKFVGRVDASREFAGNAKERRGAGARRDEDGVEAALSDELLER